MRSFRPFHGGVIELQEQDRSALPPEAATGSPAAPARPPGSRPGSGPGPEGGRGALPVLGPLLVPALVPALLSLVLGLWGITREGSMWRDESVTYQVAHRSLPEIADLLRQADAVHGLYYVLMHALFGVWDGGLVALRLPSVLAVAVTAGLVAGIALRLTSRPAVGLVSGLVFAVTPEVQMYAQEGRSYAMVCALVALATYLFVTLTDDGTSARGTSRRIRWFLYGATVLAASLLHEFAVLALLAHGITLYRSPAVPAVPAVPAASRRCFAVAAAGVAVALLPLVVLSAGQSGQVSWIGNPKLREWFEIGGVAALASACAWYLSRPDRHPSRPDAHPAPAGRAVTLPRLALPLTLAPTAALLLAAVHEPMYVDRYVLYSAVGLALLVGAAVVRLTDRARQVPALRGRAARTSAAGVMVLLSAAALLPVTLQMRTPDSRKDDVTAIAREAGRLARYGDADAVLFTPARRREWMLSYPGQFGGLSDIALKDGPVASGTLQGTERTAPDIRQRLARAERVVVLSDPAGQPLDKNPEELVKRQVLEQHFTACHRTALKGGQVTLYTRTTCP
ncbi:protein O-mannosyl-transferase family [Streptomyces sp. NPDC051567]|uniref:glycosyltransferase family 39 protein n=1 Tax=Streptomyces sp. NPDC051567 TaxID=3365660 RepID=UPI0037ACD6C8